MPGSVESGGGGNSIICGTWEWHVYNQLHKGKQRLRRTEEVPDGRRQRDPNDLDDHQLPLRMQVASVRRPWPRVRMRSAAQWPHPNANPQVERPGMKVNFGYDVNFSIAMRNWIEVNKD